MSAPSVRAVFIVTGIQARLNSFLPGYYLTFIFARVK
jgi:hypothetical protein